MIKKINIVFIAAGLLINLPDSNAQGANTEKWVSLLKDKSPSQVLKRQEAFNLIEKQDTASIISSAYAIEKIMAGGNKRTKLIGKATKAKLLFYYQLPVDSARAEEMKEALNAVSVMDEPYLEAEYGRYYAEMLNTLKKRPLAVQYAITSLKLQEHLGILHFTGVSSFTLSLGEMIYKTKNSQDAIGYLLKGLRLSETDTVPYFQKIFAYNNLGLCYRELKKFDSALYYFQKCMDISLANNRPDWWDNASNNRYDCYIGLAQYDSSEAIAGRLLKDGIEYNDEPTEMIASWMLGASYLKSGVYDKSLPLLLRSKELVDKFGDRSLYKVNKNIAECYEGLGQPGKAYPFFKVYKQLSDSENRVKEQYLSKNLLIKAQYDTEQLAIKSQESKRKKQIRLRNTGLMLLAALAAGSLWWLNRKRKKSLLKNKETTEKLHKVRNEISADLHDELGSVLTQISLQSDMVNSGIYTEEEKRKELENISATSRRALTAMSDIVWSVKAGNDKISSLVDRMRDHADMMLAPLHVQLDFTMNGLDEEKEIDNTLRQELYLIFKEAVNNIVKHCHPTAVQVKAGNHNGQFEMLIKNDINGGKENKLAGGNGLANMKHRAENIGAQLEIKKEENSFTLHLKRQSI